MIFWNYLRARGEYGPFTGSTCTNTELPPRTRRIHHYGDPLFMPEGTTSAHAENTRRIKCQVLKAGNYLRARGEYVSDSTMVSQFPELPPRTRRIHLHRPVQINFLGTTSAHAENTLRACLRMNLIWNYLRARGEYFLALPTPLIAPELPPRTRRIPEFEPAGFHYFGTTSAHAENTSAHGGNPGATWNYLRARGEYRSRSSGVRLRPELPPRTRRIP